MRQNWCSDNGAARKGGNVARHALPAARIRAMDEPRYIIIHGHFYQPPRESPWTGLVGIEPGAAPFANWNERILSECYSANAHAQMMEGHVVHIRNNYESLDINFGPTLAAWLENHGKVAYRAIRRADELSVKNHDGHGNANAQSTLTRSRLSRRRDSGSSFSGATREDSSTMTRRCAKPVRFYGAATVSKWRSFASTANSRDRFLSAISFPTERISPKRLRVPLSSFHPAPRS